MIPKSGHRFSDKIIRRKRQNDPEKHVLDRVGDAKRFSDKIIRKEKNE